MPVLWSLLAALGADDQLKIELDGRTRVNLHFDTRANRTYALQYRNAFGPTNSTGWSNLLVIPAEPFVNHHVVTDTRTNQQRFYRLRITR